MGFFDKAKGKLGVVREGAPGRMQRYWKSLPEWKKNQLRRTLIDSDHDGVPDKFDCQPHNPRMQEPKMQLDITDEEDKYVILHKVNRGFETKQEAVRDMIRGYAADVVPRKRRDDE